MIPHRPPMLFPVEGEEVILPVDHPMAHAGSVAAVALAECAAQLAGRRVEAADGHAGMLVEVEGFRAEVDAVPVGTRLRYVVTLERTMGPLWRFRVVLVGVLSVGVTLRIAAGTDVSP